MVIEASRGLGKRITLTLAKAGADLIFFSLSLKPLQEVAKEMRQVGKENYAIECDINDILEIEKLHQSTMEEFLKVD